MTPAMAMIARNNSVRQTASTAAFDEPDNTQHETSDSFGFSDGTWP